MLLTSQKKKFVLLSLALLVSLLAVGIAKPHKALAAWTVKDERPNYFTLPNPAISQTDVVDVVRNDFNNQSGTPKQKLINGINAAGSFKSLYVQLLVGGSANWQNILNSNAVTVTEGGYTTKTNSGWSPGDNALIFAYEHYPYSATSLLVYYNGTLTAVIKEDCGNFLGQIPAVIPDMWTLANTAKASPTTAKPGDTVKFTYTTLNNGTDTATFKYGDVAQFNDGTPGIYWPTQKAYPNGFSGSLPPDGKTSTGSYDTQNVIIPSPTTATQLCGWRYVDPSSSPNGKPGRSTKACVSITKTPQKCLAGQTGTWPKCITPAGGNCPGDQTISTNPNVNIFLSDQTPAPTSPPTATATSPNTVTVNRIDTNKNAKIISTQDATGIGAPATLTGTATSYNNAQVSYEPFVQKYPYDQSQASVTYQTYYKIDTYKKNTYCPGADSVPVGNTCYTNMGVATKTSGVYTCPAGDLMLPDTSKPPVYYCHAPNGIYPYTYVYSSTSATDYLSPQSITTNAYTMNACYYRNFSVDSVAATATMSPNYENPTTGTGSATASITFSLSQGGALRKPFVVNNLGYTASFSGGCTDTATGTFNATGTTSPGSVSATIGNVTCGLSPPVPIGTTVCVTYTVTPTGTLVDQNGAIQSNNGASVSGSSCSSPVQNEPYLKVYGGDVSAGNGFMGTQTSCTPTLNAQIQAWNTGTAPSYNGAGTELAALAPGIINGFASNQSPPYLSGLGGGSSGLPKALSFANTTLSTYGGNFGGNPGCSPDYYGAVNGTALGSGSSINLSQKNANGTPQYNGSYTVAGAISNISGALVPGQHVVIYATGDVYIGNNITFASLGLTVADLPSFTLIVKGGNIYVDGAVSTLSGNYIAQGGTIYDCTSANGTPWSTTQIYDNCGNKLTVNGSFVANTIKFYRMGSTRSLRFSTSDAGPGSNNASEEFDYTPVNWLAPPPSNGKPPAYDAITSLPPVL